MNVLSLCDGMSCGIIALERQGIKVNKYYASEIKKQAIKVSNDNYPQIVRLGDLLDWRAWDMPWHESGLKWKDIDLVIAGTPCQDFSLLKVGGEGLLGMKSRLFYEFLEILNLIKRFNPKVKFLLENVKMKKDSELQLNKYLGVDGVHINSRLVSYQNRPRIYWSNIPGITIPKDKNINFQDFKDNDYDYCSKFKVNRTPSRERMWSDGDGKNGGGSCANVTNKNKVQCLTRKQDRSPNSGLIEHDDFCRYLTRRELELAQTVPEGYTKAVSYNQSQDLLGDGWTIDVIAHIFKGLKH